MSRREDRAGGIRREDREFPKARFFRLVSPQTDGMRESTLTLTDIGGASVDLGKFDCKVTAENCGPLLNESSRAPALSS